MVIIDSNIIITDQWSPLKSPLPTSKWSTTGCWFNASTISSVTTTDPLLNNHCLTAFLIFFESDFKRFYFCSKSFSRPADMTLTFWNHKLYAICRFNSAEDLSSWWSPSHYEGLSVTSKQQLYMFHVRHHWCKTWKIQLWCRINHI